MYHFLGKEMGMQPVLTSESHTSQVIASWEDTWCSIWCGNPGFVDPFTRKFHCLYGVYTSPMTGSTMSHCGNPYQPTNRLGWDRVFLLLIWNLVLGLQEVRQRFGHSD